MNPVIVISLIPVVVGIVVLGGFAWKRSRADRLAKEENNRAARALETARAIPLPQDAAELRTSLTGGSTQKPSDGRIQLLLVGTFAENLGQNLLRTLALCNLERAVGSVLVLELDTRRREHFLSGVPDVFDGRIEVVRFSGLAGGGGNDPDAVRAQIAGWGPATVKGAARVIERHLAAQHGDEPAQILVVLGQGGQTPLGPVALKVLRGSFPRAKCYGLTALPVDDLLRQRVGGTLAEYRAAGVDGFIVADNLQDELRNDFGMVAAITAFVDASEHSDAAVEGNNGFYLLFTKAPGKLVSFSTTLRMIPGYRHQPHPQLPPRYFIYKQSLISAVLSGLEQVKQPEQHALGLPLGPGAPGTAQFDLVLAAVVPEALQEDIDDIVLGQQMQGTNKRNYHLLAGSIATEINPEAPRCPVAVVALRALPDGDAIMTDLTALPTIARPAALTNGKRQGKRSKQHVAS